MTLDLATLATPADALDYRTGEGVMPLVASINDRAYSFEGTPFTDMTAQHPEGSTWDYVALADGKPAASLVIHPVAGDASVQFVATLPEARGRGLASRLMHRALWDARERGCDLSSLQATKTGQPIYARMGYRAHGALQMWERRG